MRRVAAAVIGALVLGATVLAAVTSRAEAQGAPPVAVTISVAAGDQRFSFSPGTTGEALVELPAGTPALLSAAIEGNLTALGQWQLTLGPANGRGVAIGCSTPCTTTQVRVDGRPGDEYAARATVLAGGRHAALSPVVRLTWGNVGATPVSDMPEQGTSVDPVRAAVVLGIGVLLAAAAAPLAMGKRR